MVLGQSLEVQHTDQDGLLEEQILGKVKISVDYHFYEGGIRRNNSICQYIKNCNITSGYNPIFISVTIDNNAIFSR